jgi:hypothetical protein
MPRTCTTPKAFESPWGHHSVWNDQPVENTTERTCGRELHDALPLVLLGREHGPLRKELLQDAPGAGKMRAQQVPPLDKPGSHLGNQRRQASGPDTGGDRRRRALPL